MKVHFIRTQVFIWRISCAIQNINLSQDIHCSMINSFLKLDDFLLLQYLQLFLLNIRIILAKFYLQKKVFFQPLMCHNFSNVNVSNDEGENGIRGGVQGKVFKKKYWNSKLKFLTPTPPPLLTRLFRIFFNQILMKNSIFFNLPFKSISLSFKQMWIIYQVPKLLLKINVWQAAWESFQGYCKIFYLLINPSQAGKHWELVWEDPGENLKLWCSFSSFKFLLKIPSRARISRAVDNSVHQKFGFNYCCQLVAVSHWYFKLQSLSRHMPSNISHSSEIDVITAIFWWESWETILQQLTETKLFLVQDYSRGYWKK